MLHGTAIASKGRRSGFTLIELLVVVAIIAVLAGLLLPAMAKAKSQARKANEMSSAHQLLLAWQMYADDHHDRVLPGYMAGYEAADAQGQPVMFPINKRYPWRLYPYLGRSFGVIYANENRLLLDKFQHMEGGLGTYAASVFPSLGINSTFVGGDDQELAPEGKALEVFGDFCVLRTTQTRHPSELMAFASARGPFEGKIVNGFYLVRSPFFMARRWSQDFLEADGPEAWGHVHPRFSNRAIACLTDGHVEAFSKRELQDMRHWANQADRADWTLTRAK